MIWSVSILSIGSGARRLVNVVNFSIFLTKQRAHIRDYASDGARRRRERARQKRSSTLALPPFEIAIAGRDAVLARLQLVAVHRDAHRAAGLAPIRARFFKDAVQ